MTLDELLLLVGPGRFVGLLSHSIGHNNLKAHSSTIISVHASLVPMLVSLVHIDMALNELETFSLLWVGIPLIPVLVCCLGFSGE